MEGLYFGRNGHKSSHQSLGSSYQWLILLVLVAACGEASPYSIDAEARPDERLHRLVISPSNPELQTGASLQFAAFLQDELGRQQETTPIQWSATGGTISKDGLYVAGSEPGIYEVSARSRGLAASQRVSILARSTTTPTSLSVTPVEANLVVGESRRFSAVLYDQNNSPMLGSIDWSATGGTISSTGLYTAGSNTGTFGVIARSGNLTASAIVNLSNPTPTRIDISPSQVQMTSGDRVSFSATVRDQNGQPMSASIRWEATGGSIDQNGNYVAGSVSGDYRVVARSGDLSATASVHIETSSGSGSTTVLYDNFENHDFTKWGGWAPRGDSTAVGRGGGGSHAGEGWITRQISHNGVFSWRAQVDPSTTQSDPDWNIGKSGLARWEVLDGIRDFTVSTWYYFPQDYPPVFSNIMQIKEWGDGHRPTAVIAVHKYELVLYEGLNKTIPARSGVTVPRGRWVKITSRFIIDRYNGRVTAWLDGTKVLDIGGLNTLGTTDDVYFGVGNYVSAGTVTRCHLYIDDVQVTR